MQQTCLSFSLSQPECLEVEPSLGEFTVFYSYKRSRKLSIFRQSFLIVKSYLRKYRRSQEAGRDHL